MLKKTSIKHFLILLLLFLLLAAEYGKTVFHLRWTGYDVNVAPNLQGLSWVISGQTLAVNSLLLLFGALFSTYKTRVRDMLKVWALFMVYSVIVFLLALSLGQVTFSPWLLFEALFPIFGQIWPLGSLLFILFFFKPLLDRVVARLNEWMAFFLTLSFLFFFFLLPSIIFWNVSATFWQTDILRILGWVSLFLIGWFVAKFHWEEKFSKKILLSLTCVLLLLYFASQPILRMIYGLPYSDEFFWDLARLTNQHWSLLGFFVAIFLVLSLWRFVFRNDLQTSFAYTFLGMYLLLSHPYLSRFLMWRLVVRNSMVSSNLRMVIYIFGTILVLMIVAFFLESAIFKGLRDFWKNQSSKSSAAFISFFMVSFGFILFNLLQNQFNWVEVARWAGGMPVIYLYNFLLFAAVYLLFLMLINRIWLASFAYMVFVGVIGFANWQKIVFRNEPILPSDWEQIMILPQLSKMIGLGKIVSIIFGLIILGMIVYFAQKKLLSGKIFDWKTRVVSIALSVGLLTFFGHGLQNYTREMTKANPSLSAIILHAADYHPNPETVGFNTMKNGWAFNFLSLFGLKPMEEPSNYNEETMQKIAEKYSDLADELNEKRTNDVNDQTVVYILSESFADPTRIPGLSLSVDPIPFVRSLMKETTSGLMFSAGFGGGTANMEFEALTSLSLNNFSPGLTTPFMQLVPNMQTFPTVADLFEQKTVIHPYTAHMYNRVNVYDRAGFQAFYHINSENKLSYFEHSGESRYINDESAYNQVLQQIKAVDGGQYIQLMTMQNHMPYHADTYADYPDITASGADFSPESLTMIESYAKGLRITDEATKDFIEAVDKLDKKVTIVFYGDHLPGGIYFGSGFSPKFDDEYANIKRQTDYFIYSNFDSKKVEKNVVAPMDFTPMMLAKTNSFVSPYYALLTAYSQNLPAFELGRMMDEDGEFANMDSLSEEQKEILEEYKLVQYDVTTGADYLAGFWFYEKKFH